MKQANRYFIDRYEGGEKTILVHIELNPNTTDSIQEFKELALSAGSQILETVTIRRFKPEPKYFVGSGKAEEIKGLVCNYGVNLVLFNHELSPAQERNLEKLLQCRVLGRTGLILDIFAQRAQSFEGKLQVELAQLVHLSTRLVRGWSHLERQRGGIGLRGPGETQLETDRRLLALRIKAIKKRLEKVTKQREQGRRARRRASIPTVSLVGYTNAGKSTLFNLITHSSTYAADQLFATLDPTLRYIKLPHLGKVILADTVGFISQLPHDLVAAFRATLEETCRADLLLHVIDMNSEDVERQIHEVEEVLKEIGAHQVKQLRVYNKVDLHGAINPRMDRDEQGRPEKVYLSALKGEGLQLLHQAITELLSDDLINCEIILKSSDGKLRALLYKMGVVQAESLNSDGCMTLSICIQRKDYSRILSNRIATQS